VGCYAQLAFGGFYGANVRGQFFWGGGDVWGAGGCTTEISGADTSNTLCLISETSQMFFPDVFMIFIIFGRNITDKVSNQ